MLGDLRDNSKRELPTEASTYFINLNKMFTFDPGTILSNSDPVLPNEEIYEKGAWD